MSLTTGLLAIEHRIENEEVDPAEEVEEESSPEDEARRLASLAQWRAQQEADARRRDEMYATYRVALDAPLPPALAARAVTYGPIYDRVLRSTIGISESGGFACATDDDIEVRWPEYAHIELRSLLVLGNSAVQTLEGMLLAEDLDRWQLSLRIAPEPGIALQVDRWPTKLPSYVRFLSEVSRFIDERDVCNHRGIPRSAPCSRRGRIRGRNSCCDGCPCRPTRS